MKHHLFNSLLGLIVFMAAASATAVGLSRTDVDDVCLGGWWNHFVSYNFSDEKRREYYFITEGGTSGGPWVLSDGPFQHNMAQNPHVNCPSQQYTGGGWKRSKACPTSVYSEVENCQWGTIEPTRIGTCIAY
jgi:hypothetical protein